MAGETEKKTELNMTAIITFLIVVFLEVVALWAGSRGGKLFYWIAGFALIIYGFSLWSTIGIMSILLVILGVANLAGGTAK